MEYRRACETIFGLALIQQLQYTEEYSDMDDMNYRAEIIGIIAAYVDAKPPVMRGRVFTFGEEILYYGTVHGTILIDTHPIQANLKTIFLPKCKEKHKYYNKFIQEKMNKNVCAANVRTLASELLRVNDISADTAKINTVAMDMNVLFDWIDNLLSKYRLV